VNAVEGHWLQLQSPGYSALCGDVNFMPLQPV
jgi:hypothetical protein